MTPNLSQSYLDKYYSVNCLKDIHTKEIVGWEYKGKYITYDAQGMRAFGYGDWAAGRSKIGDRGAGNAGWWFVDPDKGGAHFSGERSYHINVVRLTPEGLSTEAYDTSQLRHFQNEETPTSIHNLLWNNQEKNWSDQ